MLGKTQVLIGNVALLALTHHIDPGLLVGVTLGALAPDIDRAGSLITRLPVIGWLTRPASRGWPNRRCDIAPARTVC